MLGDGTKIWLNKNSKLSYNRDFGQHKREITLEGEAYFDVVKITDVPLYIHAGDIDIEVKGTAFNVNAYKSSDEIRVAMVRGLIQVTDRSDTNRNVLLHPNEKLIFNKSKIVERHEFLVKSMESDALFNGANIVFNVSKSISAQGTNALDLLGRAPGVTVGSDNNISLNGKAGAAILIDGKQTDASGTAGIINVRTLKSLIQGFSASLTSGLSYGVYLRNNQDLSLSFRKNRFTLYGSYSHFLGYYSYLYGADRIQEGRFYNSFTDDIDKRKKMGSRLGADFAIDKNQTIGVQLNGNFLFGGGITDTRTEIGLAPTNNIDQVLNAVNDYYTQQTQRYNVNLNYKYEDTLGRVINFDADYGDFTKRAGNLQSNKYTAVDNTVISDNLYRSLNGIDISLRAIKLDYTTNLWKGKVETGFKYSSVSSANDSRFLEVQANTEILDPSRSNKFAYKERITSAYVNYKKDFGKWQLQSALRMEHSNSIGKLDQISLVAGNEESISRSYINFFPYLSFNVKPSSSHSFSLSYSRRIDRPAYQNLNPFIFR